MKPIKTPKTESTKRLPLHQTRKFWLTLLALVIFLMVYQKWGSYLMGGHKGPRLPVVVAVAEDRDVPVYLSALGAVTPTYSVTVKTLINGTLLRVLFQEGQTVKAGDLLAEIDPRPYQALLIEYQGQLQRDRALLDNALIDLKRYQVLYKQNSISQQTLATQITLVEQYRGAVKIDQGLMDTVKVNLIYCEITSPMDGRIGLRLVDPGNFVQTSDTTGLAVITSVNPTTVIFTIPEDNIPEVVQQMAVGKPLVVQAYDRSEQKLLATGALQTIDNQIDSSTGTVKLRAQFMNANNQLFPSQFVNVKLLVKTLRQVTSVPTAAIQYGANDPFVYVLNDNNSVSAKPVTVGVSFGDYTTIKGIASGRSVVIDGTDKLTEGAFVIPSKPTVASNSALSSMKLSSLLHAISQLNWYRFV